MRTFVFLSMSVLFVGTAMANDDIEQGYQREEVATPTNVEKTLVDSEIVSIELRYSLTLNVCNKTKKDINLAFYEKLINVVYDTNYSVTGWYPAPKNSCTEIKNLSKGDFAFYASNGSGREWGGKDMMLCIQGTRFRRVHYDDHTCDKRLRKGFKKILIESDYHTITLE